MEELVLPTAMIDTATAAADWVIVLPVALSLMGAAAALMLQRAGNLAFMLAVLVVCAVIACEVTLLLRVFEDGPLSMTMGKWLPPFGISLAADMFGAAFALAAAVVTLVVLIYAESETPAQERNGFHAMVLLLLAGVTGSFLTGDLFNLYVWFEVMLIASFGLLVLGCGPAQLDAAVKYGFLNFLATTLFLLAAVRPGGHAQHGRYPARGAGGKSCGDGRHCRHPAAGIRHKGGGFPPQCMASSLLSHAARRGVGPVCGPADQGGRLCHAAGAGRAAAGQPRSA
jgi:hypothetical protein